MNDTTPARSESSPAVPGAVGRESAERMATEGKAVVVAYPAT
jgi:hypothetical protein